MIRLTDNDYDFTEGPGAKTWAAVLSGPKKRKQYFQARLIFTPSLLTAKAIHLVRHNIGPLWFSLPSLHFLKRWGIASVWESVHERSSVSCVLHSDPHSLTIQFIFFLAFDRYHLGSKKPNSSNQRRIKWILTVKTVFAQTRMLLSISWQKLPFFAKMLAVPFYKGTDKQTFGASVYSVAMLSFVKGTSAECQPLPLMHRVVIRAR